LDINENLIGLWRLNKGSGLVAYDTSGNGNDGALEGDNPTWVPGKSGKAINLPGANERIDCGNGAPLNQIGNGSFWIPFWMKSKDTVPLANGMLFIKQQDASNYIRLQTGTSNRLTCSLFKGGVGINNAPFSTDTDPFDAIWNHIVLVFNRTTDKALLYMNTIKDSIETDISSSPVDSSNTGVLTWGAYQTGVLAYEGGLDEMRIYTGVPTQEKIDFLHDYPSGIAIPTRIHHLRQQKIA